LLIDLVNNLNRLAEDKNEMLAKVLAKAGSMDAKKLKDAVHYFGNSKTKKLLSPVFNQTHTHL
jgi:hypothetical protein